MIQKSIYVITGGPGFGKSALIDALEKKGFHCGKDVAREFIKEQISNGGKIFPWSNRIEFSKIILQKRIKQYENALKGKICFFDRGIPDIIGFFIKDELEVPQEFFKAERDYKYKKIVFLTPPWLEIYKKDNVRRMDYNEAVVIHNILKKLYQELGYEIINIPKVQVSERVKFILSKIKE